MADNKQIDIYNEPIQRAAEIAFRQIQYLQALLPNPPGTAPRGGSQSLSSAEIDRLVSGE
jgi:hypothetical protein